MQVAAQVPLSRQQPTDMSLEQVRPYTRQGNGTGLLRLLALQTAHRQQQESLGIYYASLEN